VRLKHDFFQPSTPILARSFPSNPFIHTDKNKTFFALVVSKEDNNKHIKINIKTQQHMAGKAGNSKIRKQKHGIA
jgi:hypothetical protein